uniref:Reverse transcriptase domain-containing protein n=1 Tax=Tanacetum cinerariifolium TaxID=118510 RepID=A0A6L2MPD0_TANCI|nr:reverse transcriptase domain-containing protein [Tanacetum cinerariifolium]
MFLERLLPHVRGFKFESLRKGFPSSDYSRLAGTTFGLKNARATYQRLVDKAFQKQIGRNLEVYVDNLVIKSRTKQEVRDMEETFKTHREINMKLNPKKCAFGMREGTFLGYKVDADGLKVCPDKVEAVLNLPPLKCLKDVQRLNGEHDIHYRSRMLVKGQILANFIMERSEDDSSGTPMEDKEELPDPWILFIDGSSCTDGSGAGLILTNPEGMKFTYALRFRFEATNNEVEYEALIVEELKEKSIDEKEVLAIVEEKGRTWMTPIYKYLAEGILSDEKKRARVVRRKAGIIVSDNEKQFRDNLFKDWCEKLCIRQCFAFIKHPQTNGLVERANKSLGEGIKAWLDERSKHWMEEISHVLWAYRTMIKSSNRDTPFSLTYGTEAVIPVEIGILTSRTAKVDMIKNDEALGINLDLLEEKREQAAIQEAKRKAKMEKYYNARVRNTSFKPEELV